MSDLPSAHLSGSSVFKAITGSDPIEAERKFQDSFLFTPFARLVFSTNHFPQSKDSSQAFFRRWVVIPFTLTVQPDKRIERDILDARLADPQELSGVLNKALAALPAMKLRKGFTQSESLQAAHQEFREQTDPLATWLDRTTVMAPQGFLTKKDLLIKYNAWSEEQGRPPITAHAFTKAIRRLQPGLKEVQKTVRGNVERGFLGLQWVSSSQVSSPVHTFHNFSPSIHREEEEVDKSINREKVVKDVKSGEAQTSDLFPDSEEVDPWI